MIRYIIFWFLSIPIFAQNSEISKINYQKIENKKVLNADINLYYKAPVCYLSTINSDSRNYLDFKNNKLISVVNYKGKFYLHEKSFNQFAKPISIENTDIKILNLSCKYALYSYFSNKIEVWFTEESKLKGTPYPQFLPSSNALVLKVVINGNRTIVATKISNKINDIHLQNIPENIQKVSKAELNELIIKSRYSVLNIFKNDTINFNPDLKLPQYDSLVSDKIYHFSNANLIMKKIHLNKKQRQSAYVFAKATVQSNGDAYDRTGVLFILPPTSKKSLLSAYLNKEKKLPNIFTSTHTINYAQTGYLPVIELMRFITPFGVHHFNNKRVINNYNWEDKVVYKQDISRVFPTEYDEIWIGMSIGNYDKGGYLVNLELDFYPYDDENILGKRYIQPLFSSYMPLKKFNVSYKKLLQKDSLQIDFKLPEKVKNCELVLITTGHGGWSGGDEFNKRLNKIIIDDKLIFSVVPWRNDCASYRLFNPSSGNFKNGMSSSDYSRSNWCPGANVTPYFIPLSNLKSGKHSIKISIDMGKDVSGGSNYWEISGVLIGERQE